MKRAIISDIHGNLEALERVFRDIDRRNDGGQKIEEILCLGDVVGYGPNPRECLDLVRRRCTVVLAGNHELGLVEKIKTPRLGLGRSTGFGGLGAREGILWAIHQLYGESSPVHSDDTSTREMIERLRAPDYEPTLAQELCAHLKLGPDLKMPLTQRLLKGEAEITRQLLVKLLANPNVRELLEEFYRKTLARRDGEEHVAYLSSLPKSVRVDSALLVHDNPFLPGDSRYVLDTPTRESLKASAAYHPVEKLFSDYDWRDVRFVFFGHSHFPGIYTDKSRPGVFAANPGSVGIPRGDTLESTYLLWNPEARARNHLLRLARVPLGAWSVTGRKMEQAGLPNKLKVLADKLQKELD
jgi:predicted phosphodiesterase